MHGTTEERHARNQPQQASRQAGAQTNTLRANKRKTSTIPDAAECAENRHATLLPQTRCCFSRFSPALPKLPPSALKPKAAMNSAGTTRRRTSSPTSRLWGPKLQILTLEPGRAHTQTGTLSLPLGIGPTARRTQLRSKQRGRYLPSRRVVLVCACLTLVVFVGDLRGQVPATTNCIHLSAACVIKLPG